MTARADRRGAAAAVSAACRGPLIFSPPADGRGKYHRSTIAETAACGAPTILDTTPLLSIHVDAGAERPHPLCCRRCLAGAR